MSFCKPNPDDPDENWRCLDLSKGLQEAFEGVICRASPHFEIPAGFFASAMLRTAIRVQLMHLGDRKRVREWIEREAYLADAQTPDYLGLCDEDEPVLSHWLGEAEEVVQRAIGKAQRGGGRGLSSSDANS